MRYCPICQTTYPPGVESCPRDGQLTLALSTPEQDDPYLGKFAGSYQLIQKLGEGGMGVIYLAKHPTLGKRAAVKLLHTEIETQHLGLATERFFTEAKIVSQLGHENIVDVYDFGLLDGRHPYFVMEYLEGESLSALLGRETRLSQALAIEITTQLLEALSVAHAHGVVHRDLKPDNTFLVPRRGRYLVKLLDFGIAKLLDSTEKLTKVGMLIGTPQYMSPEQVEGEVELDGRADLYSVGVLLFEMLCGRPPFTGMVMGAIALAHTMEPPPSPRSLRPELSPALEAIVLRALEKAREDRHQSAEEMIAALQSVRVQSEEVPEKLLDAPTEGLRSNLGAPTRQRENPFDEPLTELPTMASPVVAAADPPTMIAVKVTPAVSQEESTKIAISSLGERPTRPASKELPRRTPDAAAAKERRTPDPTSLRRSTRPPAQPPDAEIPATMAVQVVSPTTQGTPMDAEERRLSDAMPTVMASTVAPRSAPALDAPTAHMPIVTPLRSSTIEDPDGSPVPFSSPSGAYRSKQEETSLDAKPSDAPVAAGSSREGRLMVFSIAVLSFLAVVLWALAFR